MTPETPTAVATAHAHARWLVDHPFVHAAMHGGAALTTAHNALVRRGAEAS